MQSFDSGDPQASLTDRQKRVVDRLRRLVGEGGAQFFEDACDLMNGQHSMSTATHMVGHAAREIVRR